MLSDYAFFYCSANEAGSQLPINVLGSFVAQLCKRQPQFWPALEDYYKKTLENSGNQLKTAELPALQKMLADICHHLPRVLLFLDALNESPHALTILQALFRILEATDNVRVLVTSTEDTKIPQSQLCPVRAIDMDAKSIAADIEVYIDSSVDSVGNLQRLSRDLREEAKASLLAKSDGS